MKIIIFLALASVGLCNGFRCDAYKNDLANDKKCLKHALKNGPGLMGAAEQICCKHRNHKGEKTDEYYKELKEKLEVFMGCTGCHVGSLTGLQRPLGGFVAGHCSTTGDVVKAMEGLEESLGLDNSVLDLACTMLDPDFVSDCGENLFRKFVLQKSTKVKDLLCQKHTEMDVKEAMETLKGADCLSEDVLGTSNIWDNLSEDDCKALAPALTDLVRSLKDDPVIGKFFSSNLCTMGEALYKSERGGIGGLTSYAGGTSDGLLGGLLGGGLLNGVLGRRR